MLILAINGSPRSDGFTARLLQAAREAIESAVVKYVFLQVSDVMARLKVPYCVACTSPCSGKCYEGTQLEEFLNLMRKADGIMVGSPVYFSTVSAPLKAFWDKTRRLRYDKALLNVVGGALSIGNARFGGQETTLRALHDMMLCQGMIIVGDGYVNGDAGHQGVCAQAPLEAEAEELKRVLFLAKRMVEVADATKELRAKTRGEFKS